MASKQTEALNALYRGWAAALQANPEMPLEEMRLMLEQWGNITGAPRGVDYIETAAGEVPALWAAPKNCAEDRVLLCAHGGGYVAASMCPRKIQMSVFLQFRSVSGTLFWVGRRAGAEPPA